jgi:hypothetical protein
MEQVKESPYEKVTIVGMLLLNTKSADGPALGPERSVPPRSD